MNPVTSAHAPSMALTVRIATSNEGKLRDFAGAAAAYGVSVEPLPGLDRTAAPREPAPTFEANAAIKAEFYSRLAKDDFVLADDSGLSVDFLNGAPGVHSARYAALLTGDAAANSTDPENNARLLRELDGIEDERRTAHFICCIAVARNGRLVAMFRGQVPGIILHEPRGAKGFGYDPLFLIPDLNKTFAELDPEEKAKFSHRGLAFRKFLKWFSTRTQQALQSSDL